MSPPPLSPRQRQAAALLAQGLGPTAVSKALSVNRSTLHSWRKRPDFQALLEGKTEQTIEAIENVVATARDDIMRLLPKVVASIEDALDATTYIVDGQGMVHEVAAWFARARARRDALQVSGLLIHRVEHSGEIRGLSALSDEELRDAIRKLDANPKD
jgi:hypothetical protein